MFYKTQKLTIILGNVYKKNETKSHNFNLNSQLIFNLFIEH